MLWILLPLLLLLSLIIYLLFAPLSIEINTERNRYCFRYHRLASVYIDPENDGLAIMVKILFWKRRISLEREPPKTSLDKEEPKTQKKNAERKWPPLKKIIAVIRSFRVQRCTLILNTGDMQLNGLLFPILYWAGRYTGRNIRIDFTGETKIDLKIQNNIARMVRAFISA